MQTVTNSNADLLYRGGATKNYPGLPQKTANTKTLFKTFGKNVIYFSFSVKKVVPWNKIFFLDSL